MASRPAPLRTVSNQPSNAALSSSSSTLGSVRGGGIVGRRNIDRSQAERASIGGVDDDASAGNDLSRRHERRQRLRQQAVDRPLELARSVLRTDPAAQEHVARGRRHLDLERSIAQPRVDMALQLVDVMVEDPRDRLRVERLVGHDDIDAVDELRREAFAHRSEPDRLETAGDLCRRPLVARR